MTQRFNRIAWCALFAAFTVVLLVYIIHNFIKPEPMGHLLAKAELLFGGVGAFVGFAAALLAAGARTR